MAVRSVSLGVSARYHLRSHHIKLPADLPQSGRREFGKSFPEDSKLPAANIENYFLFTENIFCYEV